MSCWLRPLFMVQSVVNVKTVRVLSQIHWNEPLSLCSPQKKQTVAYYSKSAFLRIFHNVSCGETLNTCHSVGKKNWVWTQNITSWQQQQKIEVTASKSSIWVAPQRQWASEFTVSLCNPPFTLISESLLCACCDTLPCSHRPAGSVALIQSSCVCVADLLSWNHRHIWQEEHATLHLLHTCTQVLSLFVFV